MANEVQWNIVETVVGLDISFLRYLPIKTRNALLSVSTGVFGVTYPTILQSVKWETLVTKRSYKNITRSLGILHKSRPLLRSIHVPWYELNKSLLAEVDRGNPQYIPALVAFGAQLNTQIPATYKIPVSKPIKNHKHPHPSVHNMSALHLACSYGFPLVVDVLVQHGADYYSILPDKRTPLDLAAQGKHREVVRILVRCLLRDINSSENAPPPSLFGEWNEDKVVEMVTSLGELMDLQTRCSLLHALVDYSKTGKSIGTIAELLVDFGSHLELDTSQGVTPLHYAAQQGCCELVKKYIEFGADIEKKAQQWFTPLHMACYEGKLDVAELLIENGADIHASNKSKETPFILACRVGAVKIVRILLARGVKADEPNEAGITPLQSAARTGQAEIIRELVDAGASVEYNSVGSPPINIAAFYGHINAVRVLIEKGANADVEGVGGDTPLHSAAVGGFAELVRELLAAKVRVDPPSLTGATPLTLASLHGRKDCVELLVKAGANLNVTTKDEVPPLTQALSRSHTELAKQLIKHGASVEHAESENRKRNKHPIIWESSYMDAELLTMLVKRGATLSRNYMDHAIRKSWVDVVRAILDLGECPNAGNIPVLREEMPLHSAAQLGHAEIVEMLIDFGAERDPQDRNDQTPLYRAVMKEKEAAVEVLLRRGVNVNAKTSQGITPLELALIRNTPKIAEMLILHGADLTLAFNEGNSALHQAAIAHLPSIVRLLLAKGASTAAKNNQNETPLDSALRIRDILVELNDKTRLTWIDEVIGVFTEYSAPRTTIPQSASIEQEA